MKQSWEHDIENTGAPQWKARANNPQTPNMAHKINFWSHLRIQTCGTKGIAKANSAIPLRGVSVYIYRAFASHGKSRATVIKHIQKSSALFGSTEAALNFKKHSPPRWSCGSCSTDEGRVGKIFPTLRADDPRRDTGHRCRLKRYRFFSTWWHEEDKGGQPWSSSSVVIEVRTGQAETG